MLDGHMNLTAEHLVKPKTRENCAHSSHAGCTRSERAPRVKDSAACPTQLSLTTLGTQAKRWPVQTSKTACPRPPILRLTHPYQLGCEDRGCNNPLKQWDSTGGGFASDGVYLFGSNPTLIASAPHLRHHPSHSTERVEWKKE
jgi:hypothetical protein